VNNHRYVARSSDIAARRLGNEMMIIAGRDSTLFSLNEVATVIWEAADGLTALDEIVEQRICQEFDVELAEALQDAEALAEALAEHGIFLLSDKPFQSSPSGKELE